MTFKEVIEFQYITVAEAKEVLEKLVEKRKEIGELSFEARKTMNYLSAVAKLDAEKARELVDELEKLPHVTREIAIKIADILPDIPDEVRVVYAKERVTLTPEQIQEILDIVKKYKN
ncbi:DNA-directed RNA polymerase, subunit F [Geoglobus ahangari]|uniref:DNA-directed RNA polymerase subunit Rpo4 n=1 Tax=Geoglobus ahangari TaxID=113653 RepID=A0A0F7DBS6_9EURY|nr:RNA polymerase Rpb4 family protein [Geoglobus ahangari]AKG91606.1 DNA-directed RNA polymerase, subunit F [Geoglobus ahangari]